MTIHQKATNEAKATARAYAKAEATKTARKSAVVGDNAKAEEAEAVTKFWETFGNEIPAVVKPSKTITSGIYDLTGTTQNATHTVELSGQVERDTVAYASFAEIYNELNLTRSNEGRAMVVAHKALKSKKAKTYATKKSNAERAALRAVKSASAKAEREAARRAAWEAKRA